MPKGVKGGLSAERIRQLAQEGAEKALNQLRAEIIAIERTFPELSLPRRRRELRQTIEKVQRRGRAMSAAARKEVSARMKKYWAERRKAQAKTAKS
jgi:Holliday junction resolvasome RuvABC endonuclease subunit